MISGGSVRDVLADTNNLSERWERLPTAPALGKAVGRRRGWDRQ
ncbi:hypothetical protein SCATT_45890 [Streptantibioticus cattleyicolor NRRL 8057 = DSM 46488]|uniref:Uncharacterized protein n=1 Tax=Streptantibioticus cattleyicolor (strain ATCC 35852 / DSM 46488 / JCM 4925 / NBRC 14057 / NRRL 8057) TaxID=1003195 RepID=G8X3A9_STREN|nr:hypothetical protein SCATT_45890 [Streptantibioticus cattleyicolor NRRL 8057 = DSM 46488]